MVSSIAVIWPYIHTGGLPPGADPGGGGHGGQLTPLQLEKNDVISTAAAISLAKLSSLPVFITYCLKDKAYSPQRL